MNENNAKKVVKAVITDAEDVEAHRLVRAVFDPNSDRTALDDDTDVEGHVHRAV